jgi:hypothetical protein
MLQGNLKSPKDRGAASVTKHLRKIALAAGLTLLAGIASAGGTSNWNQGGNYGGNPPTCVDSKFWECRKVTAPEMDPKAMIGAVTLLLGGLLVLRGRKANN